jgi:hypothetical protein
MGFVIRRRPKGGREGDRYRAFADKPEHNFHRDIIFKTFFKIGKSILLFYGTILDSYLENLVGLGCESCSSGRESGSNSCVPVFQ